jgi:hypothetical protein
MWEKSPRATAERGELFKEQNSFVSKTVPWARIHASCLRRRNFQTEWTITNSLIFQEGIDMSLQQDQTTQWFNTLWADNGDAISKQYASTAALKGDFTRTRKRDYKGALTDMGLSISRFYSG